MSGPIVIAGAGQAGAQLVASLRTEGYEGPIVMVGDEPYVPYQRPPLSKAFLAGELAADRLFIRPAEFYAEAKCELMLGVSVTAIDRAKRKVTLGNGKTLDYEFLAITTGSRVRHVSLPGAELPGVHYLRGIADVEQLQSKLKAGLRLTVIGGGYIGLEVAAVARKHGLDVTVLEMAPRVMARGLSELVSHFFEAEHRKKGVVIHTGARVDGIVRDDDHLAVQTSVGPVAADFVLIGVGVVPNVELALAAGLKVDNGIVVDEFARTSDPHIYAIGDCANSPCAFSTLGRARPESVQNAIDQAKHAAMAMCGKPKPYAEVPWFWSDQYDLKLQIAGISMLGDEVVLRGDPATRKFAAFYLRDGLVAAVDAINAVPEYMVARTLIAQKKGVDAARLADLSVPMKAFLA